MDNEVTKCQVLRIRRWTWFAIVFSLAALAVPASATIHYSVSVGQPEEHRFGVTMVVPEVREKLIVQLPAWNALYQVRDFAQYVQAVRAMDSERRTLPVRKLDKQTWEIRGSGLITVSYSAYWDEASPFASQLNADHAFINLATILFYVPDRRGEDARVTFTDLPEGWRVAVALPPGESSFTYRAANYDALVDAPVEMGTFQDFRFEAGKARVRVVVDGEGWNQVTLTESLRHIVRYQTELMRDVPFEEFLFIYHIGRGGGGGMEHANSTAIHLSAGSSPDGISAHELFHLWNVKRIRPRSLEPVDYSRENWTRALWFAEGVTSTYASYTLVRTGLTTRRQFLDELGREISQLESRPARLWKSVEEASLDAWLEKYSFHNRPDSSISYYTKGQILGVLLDILIRDATDNRTSLDDVLRYLNDQYARAGRFYDDSDGIRHAVEAVLGRTGGRESQPTIRDFFARYVEGTEELPYADLLARAGLTISSSERPRAVLGFSITRRPDGSTMAAQVPAGSTAARAGIRAGDVLVELDGRPVTRNLDRELRSRQPGDSVRIRLRRGGTEQEVSLELERGRETSFEILEESRPTEKQRRVREGLLGGTTN